MWTFSATFLYNLSLVAVGHISYLLNHWHAAAGMTGRGICPDRATSRGRETQTVTKKNVFIQIIGRTIHTRRRRGAERSARKRPPGPPESLVGNQDPAIMERRTQVMQQGTVTGSNRCKDLYIFTAFSPCWSCGWNTNVISNVMSRI